MKEEKKTACGILTESKEINEQAIDFSKIKQSHQSYSFD